jgi:hypothetical protein
MNRVSSPARMALSEIITNAKPSANWPAMPAEPVATRRPPVRILSASGSVLGPLTKSADFWAR